MQGYNNDLLSLSHGDSMDFYDSWDKPAVIMSDGPYGLSSYNGDLRQYEELAAWYEPHVKKWIEKAPFGSTLWFWNTEIGWAVVHPILVKMGWSYKGCNVWNKGIGHIAGNHNSQKATKLPVVTEVCAQYVKEPVFDIAGKQASAKEWLRHEWRRAGLSLSLANEATGTKNAATRKYLTQDHLWYSPPAEHFQKLVDYAAEHGKPTKRPYFSMDGKKSLTAYDWQSMKPKFNCPHGVTNVWSLPKVAGKERLKAGTKVTHINQKPLQLMDMLIKASSDKGDVIWEPFGGLCSAMVSAFHLGRRAFGAEINDTYFVEAVKRLTDESNVTSLNLEVENELLLDPSEEVSSTPPQYVPGLSLQAPLL
jgi:DNA modification methylase